MRSVSPLFTFRTWRNVRVESAKRSKADMLCRPELQEVPPPQETPAPSSPRGQGTGAPERLRHRSIERANEPVANRRCRYYRQAAQPVSRRRIAKSVFAQRVFR
jgi:hypothetical protein